MRTPLLALAPALVLLLASTTVDAGPGDLTARASAAQRDLVVALEQVARWCNARKIFGKRDETYELILEFEPDHGQARRTLKFDRRGGGSWVQAAGYKRPRNWNPKLFAEHAGRIEGALLAYRDAMLAVCASATTGPELTWAAATALALQARFAGDAKLRASHRTSLLRHLALLEPSPLPVELERVTKALRTHFGADAEVRRALGEVRHEGRWVLPATAHAEKNRARYRDVAEAAHNGVAHPRKTALTDDEQATGLPLRGAFETAHMRLVGTTTDSSLSQIASSCEAAAAFFQSVLRREPQRARTYTLYVFARRQDWTTFVERYPLFPLARKQEARATRLSGFGIGPATYAVLPVSSPEAERDLCVDVTFQHLLQMTFNPVPRKESERGDWRQMPGWVRIGLSDYLTYRLIGTRILTTVGGEYGRPLDDPDARVPDKDTEWLQEALAILERHGARGTHLMLGRTLGAFGRDDAVTSFAFASFLLEGRPAVATPILTEIAKGRPIQDVVREVMGLTIEALHVDLVRWLEDLTSAR